MLAFAPSGDDVGGAHPWPPRLPALTRLRRRRRPLRCPAPVPRRATCSDSSGQESSGAEAAADNLPDSVKEFGAWVRESCRRRGEHPGECCSLTFTKREVIPWETVACPRRGLLRASLERCNSAPAAPQAAPSPRSALKQASSGSRAEGGAGGRQLRFA